MSLRDRLIRLAAFKLLGDEVAAAVAREKAGLMDEVGGRMGATAATIEGREVGTVSIAQGRPEQGSVNGWIVTNRRAWIEFVREYRPSAIIEDVRASDEKDLLNHVEQITEEREGDLPPGISPALRGDDYVMVKQSPEQRANAIHAWREGLLSLPDMAAQIEEGGDE